MANFLTSFATGGLKAGINQMSRVVEERGEILDNLRPIVQEKFSLLNDNKAGTEIEKVATQFRSRKFLTNQILEQTSNVKDLVMSMENPDLAFNNLAGGALEFGRR